MGALEGDGQVLGAIGAQAHAFVALIQDLGARSGSGKLDEDTASDLLTCDGGDGWFLLAHADALQRTFRRDPQSAEAVALQAKTWSSSCWSASSPTPDA